MENSNHTIGNRTLDFQACQATANIWKRSITLLRSLFTSISIWRRRLIAGIDFCRKQQQGIKQSVLVPSVLLMTEDSVMSKENDSDVSKVAGEIYFV